MFAFSLTDVNTFRHSARFLKLKDLCSSILFRSRRRGGLKVTALALDRVVWVRALPGS